MEKIPSFTIDHEHLLRGIYVSRKDNMGNQVITTFDIRMKDLTGNRLLERVPYIQWSIWRLLFYVIILNGEIKSYIGDLWDVLPEIIYC